MQNPNEEIDLNSKDYNSSSEELNIEELSEFKTKKKPHFLDYANSAELDTQIINNACKLALEKPKKAQINVGECSGTSHVIKKVEKISTVSHKVHETSAMSKNGGPSSSSSVPAVDSIYSILSMLGNYNSSDTATKFLEYSRNRENCVALRRSGCISLLVQIIHSENDDDVRNKARQALHNVVHFCSDDKSGRREARVLKLIEQLFEFCDQLRMILSKNLEDNVDRHPIQAIGTLMKISFDEEHRHCMTQLGALQTISSLIQNDYSVHGPINNDTNCITLRRYAGMTLTNLTFGDCNNKAILCSNKNFMKALIDQINSNSDELVQVTASVLRNLSWRADANMKEVLNELGTVKVLTLAAMKCTQENTLKAILSALWNLSNHCAKNKAEFCEIDGAIEFLIDMLSYEAPSKTMAVIENTGGILRNISSHIATKEELRVILRRKSCFSILLQQLKSPSLTVVSNACGTLGNLSAHCVEDQKFLRDNGAIPMLRSLIYSKHKMISTGSTIALRHLLGCRSSVTHNENMDSVAKMMDLKELPTLNVRKQRALEHELDKNLAENYDTDDQVSPTSEKGQETNSVSSRGKEETEINKDGVKSTSKQVKNIEDDEEEDEESPINFSAKYKGDTERSEYQETNLDQITDYSLRYAENHSESDEEVPKRQNALPADDAVHRYNTEGTPHTISHSTSMTDLREKKEASKEKPPIKQKPEEEKKKVPESYSASGIQSPEKTVNYCEEGTPGFFSRNDSLSDLEEPAEPKKGKQNPQIEKIKGRVSSKKEDEPGPSSEKSTENTSATPKSVTFVELTDETPLMFSRTSSMGSLSSAEPACADDKSSIVSDFSRLASGIISPSELPDSPTQSVPHSPSRLPNRVPKIETTAPPENPSAPPDTSLPGPSSQRLQSIFEDDTNTFHIENTPAHFSYATSLSNLSFDDEPKISTDSLSKDFRLISHPSEDHEREDDQQKAKVEVQDDGNFASEIVENQNEDIVSDDGSLDDNILLEDCINMGMNRAVKKSPVQEKKENPPTDNGSSTSDQDDQILEECISAGMSKLPVKTLKENPVDMMRAGAPLLPPYLPVSDETNRFLVEDSPCNFSVMSALSGLTIESNVKAGPSRMIKPSPKDSASSSGHNLPKKTFEQPKDFNLEKSKPRPEYDDSLSSLSIESEDDGNLLSQAIAAGVNSKPQQKLSTSNPINIPQKKSENAGNESISSIDSCDSKRDEQSSSILEQCIRSGIDKVVKKDSAKPSTSGVPIRPLVTSSPKKSMLPTLNKSPQKTSKIAELDKRDEELLMECIETGILKNTRTGYVPSSANANSELVHGISKLTLSAPGNIVSEPKNAETTPVIVKDQVGAHISKSLYNTITGVGVAAEKKTQTNSAILRNETENGIIGTKNVNQEPSGNFIVSRSDPSLQVNWMKLNGSNGSYDLNGSIGSIENLLERSNEYPAALLTGSYDEDDSMNTMEISNEFLVENREDYMKIDDKTKDPNLMLKSVDRLTQELVSTAEFLRKNSGLLNDDLVSSQSNTWNDENSFPSISMSAPMIASTNDDVTMASEQIDKLDEKTPTNEMKQFITMQRSQEMPNGDLPKAEANQKVWCEIACESGDYTDGGVGQPTKNLFWLDTSKEQQQQQSQERERKVWQRNPEESKNNHFWVDLTKIEEAKAEKVEKPKEPGRYSLSWEIPKDVDHAQTAEEEEKKRQLLEEKRKESGKFSLTWEIPADPSESVKSNGRRKSNGKIPGKLQESLELGKSIEKPTNCIQENFGSSLVFRKSPENADRNSMTRNSFEGYQNSNVAGGSRDFQENLVKNVNYRKSPENQTATNNRPTEELPKVNLNFKVGGETTNPSLNSFNYLSFGPTSIETCSTLSNSTIVTVEAQTVEECSTSLNLESIRPPSSMDWISLTSVQESTNGSPQFQNRFGKKQLMTGLVAKRALGQQIMCGSVESVNSMNNIDNIRPPSIMDELLDSMISVDSIISEVVDPTLVQGATNYETALSDMEDSLTLQSCMDISKDETLTPVSSDFSSVESTPTKKNSLVSKQKRQTERDRYKTYTIAVDMILKEQEAKKHEKSPSPGRKNPRQRRQEDRKRFETQVIETSSYSPSIQRRQEDPERFRTRTIESSAFNMQLLEPEDLSIQDMTVNFEFIRSEVVLTETKPNTTNIREKLNRIKLNGQPQEDSLEFEHQTSETESQRDLNQLMQKEEVVKVAPPTRTPKSSPIPPEKPAKVATKGRASNYISPYKMTARVTPPAKNSANKITKTPVIAKIVQRKSTESAEGKPPLTQKTNKVNSVKPKLPRPGFGGTPKPKSAPPSTVDTPETPTLPIMPLNRQGTFVKDEPTCENVPVVDTSPVRNMPLTKLKPPKAIAKYSSPTVEKKPEIGSPKKTSSLPTTNLKYRSNSNTSMKSSKEQEQDLNSNPPTRSNTGINLSNPRKNITSKIASLWKSTEKKETPIKKSISTSSTHLNGPKTPSSVNPKKSFTTFTKNNIKRSSTFNDIDSK